MTTGAKSLKPNTDKPKNTTNKPNPEKHEPNAYRHKGFPNAITARLNASAPPDVVHLHVVPSILRVECGTKRAISFNASPCWERPSC